MVSVRQRKGEDGRTIRRTFGSRADLVGEVVREAMMSDVFGLLW
jgi:hypothetical protein